jgi:membrane protein YdbS with pleckstrin-like domain
MDFVHVLRARGLTRGSSLKGTTVTTYFIRRGDKVAGPCDVHRLRQLVQEGRVVAGDLLAKSKSGPWVPVKAVRGLFPASEPAATASPSIPTPPQAFSHSGKATHPESPQSPHAVSAVLDGYVHSSMIPGEREVFRTRLHWIAFMPHAVSIGLGIGFLGTSFLLFPSVPRYALQAIGALMVLIGAVGLALAYLRWKSSEFAVTSHRAVMKTGAISRTTSELFISKIDSIGLSQTLLGRLLNYGSVSITVSVQLNRYVLIARPLDFVQAVQRQQSVHSVSPQISGMRIA